MAIIASPFAAARSNGPATRRLLLLALLLVAFALSLRPGEVSADPSNVQLITSGFTVWNNSVRITFDDDRTYLSSQCDGRYTNASNNTRYYTRGVFESEGTRISSDCNARDITTSAINFGQGGSRSVGISITYDRDNRVRKTPTAYSSNSYTFPARPSITSVSVSGS